MQIQTFNLGQTQLVDSTCASQEDRLVDWEKVVAKNPNKIYQIGGQSYKVLEKQKRHLPFCSVARAKGIAFGSLCTLTTAGLLPFFSKTVRRSFSGRQVRRLVETRASKAIIYMSITGHPTHLGHMAVIAEAIICLQQKYQITQAYISLASQDYLKRKVNKGDPCLTYEQRKHILLETINHATSINMFQGVPVDYTPLEQELKDHPAVHKELEEAHQDQEVFFVCGPDLYPKTAISFKKVIVLERTGMNVAITNPNHTFIHSNLYPQYVGLSSTEIRKGNASLEPESLDATFRDWYKTTAAKQYYDTSNYSLGMKILESAG